MITVESEYYVDHDFSGEDLQDHHFIKCHFYRCNFSHCDLTDSKFEACSFLENGDLTGCDFGFATLTSSQFTQCDLSLSQFKGSHCFGAEFKASNLKGADFYRASFSNYITQKSYFCSATIIESNLSYANLDGLLLEQCTLTDNRWIGANLNGVSMRGANLSGGEFSQDQWGTFDLQGANLTRIDLNGLDPRTVALKGVIISGWQQSQLLEPLGIIVQAD